MCSLVAESRGLNLTREWRLVRWIRSTAPSEALPTSLHCRLFARTSCHGRFKVGAVAPVDQQEPSPVGLLQRVSAWRLEGDRPIAHIARDLGMQPETLGQAGAGGPRRIWGGGRISRPMPGAEKEILQSRKENFELRRANEILSPRRCFSRRSGRSICSCSQIQSRNGTSFDGTADSRYRGGSSQRLALWAPGEYWAACAG
jgi:transposase-like protein